MSYPERNQDSSVLGHLQQDKTRWGGVRSASPGSQDIPHPHCCLFLAAALVYAVHAPAMKNTMTSSPLIKVLLLLLLLQGPGGCPCSALAIWNCPTDITISTAEDLANMGKFTQGTQYTNLYVHPEPGFSGVSLVVKEPGGGGEQPHAAWIALENECFQGTTEWWEVHANATSTKQEDCDAQGDCRNITGLLFGVRTSGCRKICFKPGNFSSVANYTVRGHGASKWKLHHPGNSNCTFSEASEEKFSPQYHQCPEPPAPAQEAQKNTGFITGMAAALVLGLAVLAGGSVAVVRLVNRHRV